MKQLDTFDIIFQKEWRSFGIIKNGQLIDAYLNYDQAFSKWALLSYKQSISIGSI